MSELNPQKLQITFQPGTSAEVLTLPRRYTLTHSDSTGDLFLTIGTEYDRKQISGLYTRLMRDEVLAELKSDGDEIALHVYCHVSGGIILGTAGWRNDILHHHMPMVLEAFLCGDRKITTTHPELDDAIVLVHFESNRERYNKIEDWGQVRKYQA